MTAPVHLSLYRLLQDELGERFTISRFTKATLVHISHTLEDAVLSRRLPSLMFTGFQESSYWRQETARYRQLAEVAQMVCVFAGEPLPEDSATSVVQVELSAQDSLRQEWFVIITSTRFSVVLCGLDGGQQPQSEAMREFDTFWSFEPEIVDLALDLIQHVLNRYRPHQAERFHSLRQRYPPQPPDPTIITRFVSDMIHFEEKLQQRLYSSQQQFHEVITSISDFVYAYDVSAADDIRYVYLSPNIERLMGYRVDEVIADTNVWLSRIHPEDRESMSAHLGRLYSGRSSELEYRFVHRDGRILWGRDSAHVESVDDGTRLRVYGVISDITARKEADLALLEQERLQIALQKERELSKIKSRFMLVVSHEFRTPLAIILTAAENLERYALRMTEQSKSEKLESIKSQVKHLRAMLDEIAFVIRSDLGRMGFTPESMEIVGFCEMLLGELRMSTGAEHKLVLRAYVPTFYVEADPTLMRYILINLLSNAIKYSAPHSEVALELDVQAEQLELRVVDQGIGITNMDQKRLFEPFFRGENVGTVSGTGLGLRIVEECVKLHSGTIQIESQLGVGTTCIVRLPLSQ